MPQRVRTDALRDGRLPDVAAHDAVDTAGGQSAAAQIEEERHAVVASGADGLPLRGVGRPTAAASGPGSSGRRASRGSRRPPIVPNGTSRSLPPLPRTRTTRLDRFTSSRSRSDQLAQTKSGRVEELEDGAVATAGAASRRRARRAVDPSRPPPGAPAACAPCAARRRGPSDRRGAAPRAADTGRTCGAPPAAGRPRRGCCRGRAAPPETRARRRRRSGRRRARSASRRSRAARCVRNCVRSVSYARNVCGETLRL